MNEFWSPWSSFRSPFAAGLVAGGGQERDNNSVPRQVRASFAGAQVELGDIAMLAGCDVLDDPRRQGAYRNHVRALSGSLRHENEETRKERRDAVRARQGNGYE